MLREILAIGIVVLLSFNAGVGFPGSSRLHKTNICIGPADVYRQLRLCVYDCVCFPRTFDPEFHPNMLNGHLHVVCLHLKKKYILNGHDAR